MHGVVCAGHKWYPSIHAIAWCRSQSSWGSFGEETLSARETHREEISGLLLPDLPGYFGINTAPSWQTVLAAEKIDKGRGCFQVDRVCTYEPTRNMAGDYHRAPLYLEAPQCNGFVALQALLLALPVIVVSRPVQGTSVWKSMEKYMKWFERFERGTHCTFPLFKPVKSQRSQNMYFISDDQSKTLWITESLS